MAFWELGLGVKNVDELGFGDGDGISNAVKNAVRKKFANAVGEEGPDYFDLNIDLSTWKSHGDKEAGLL